MPEDRLPVDRMAGLRSRAVGRDYAPEADSEISWIARHSKRADGKILLLRENFDGCGTLWLQSIFRAKIAPGLTKQLENLRPIYRGFMSAHAQHEIIIGKGGKLAHFVAQTGQIVCLHVVTVFLLHFPRKIPTFGLVAQSKP